MVRSLTSDGYSLTYRDIEIDIGVNEYYECGDHLAEVVYTAMVNGVSVTMNQLDYMFQYIDERCE